MKWKRRYDAVICGYYGFGNMGDEAVLSALIFALKERLPHAVLGVMCRKRGFFERCEGVFPIERFDPFAVIGSLIRSDMLILGGGSLLQNETSRRSLMYYKLILRLGKLLCRSVYIYANGIGGIRGDVSVVKKALSQADRISVRDPLSLKICRELGFSEKSALTADPVFLLGLRDERKKMSRDGEKYFAVSLREASAKDNEWLSQLIRFCKKKKKEGLSPVFVPMQEERDLPLSLAAAEKCGGYVALPSDANELFRLLRGAEFSLGMRLHFLLLSLSAGIPCVAVSLGCKIESVIPYAGGLHILPYREVTEEALEKEVALSIKNTDGENLRRRCDEMYELCRWDIDRLCSAISMGKRAKEPEGKKQKSVTR